MHLALNHKRADFAPAICSSSSYHLQSSISSLLLYVKNCFNTCAPPVRIYQETELEIILSQYLSLPIRFPIDSWVAGWLHFSLSALKELSLYKVDYNNTSSCPEALTQLTRTLNWDYPYLLQCCQTLAPIMGGLQKNQGVRWHFTIFLIIFNKIFFF